MLAMASTASATAAFFSSSSDDISLLASSDRVDSPFAPFNPAIREFAPSRQLTSTSSSTGVIGSKRPGTPAQDSFEADSFSNPGSPSHEFDERKAIPSALLDSPQATDRRPDAAVNRYSNGPSFGLRSVSSSAQQPQQPPQDMSISKLERHSSLSSLSRSKDYSVDPYGQSSTALRKASGTDLATQNSSDSSFVAEQQRFDSLSVSFEGLSVQSSVSSSSRSWQSYLMNENEPMKSIKEVARNNLPVLKEHSRSSFSHPESSHQTNMQPSRYLKITGLSKSADPILLSEKFHAFGDLRGIYTREIALNGSIIVAYFDLRHAVTSYKAVCSQPILGYHLRPHFFPKSYLTQMYESGIEIPFMSNNEGELAVYFSRGTSKRARSILEKYLPTFGSVQSLKIESETSISCEFFDVRDSASAVLTLNGQLIDDMVFYVSFKEIDAMFAKPPSPNGSDVANSPGSCSASFASENHREGLSVHAPVFESSRSNMMSLLSIPPSSTERNSCVHDSYSEPQSPADNFYYDGHIEELSPVGKPLTRHESYDYGKSKNSLDNYSQLDYFGAGKHTRRLSTSIPRSPRSDPMWDAEASLTFQVESYPDIMSRGYSVYTNATVPKNNVVDLERIARGLDTRTTLMLRNIPNKVDQQMLKEYIDVTNKNTYDFLYLRIDFLNKCNVGYAFISFTSPEAIITFAKARAGTKWNRFNSEKICDISYANIYGKECLIEKFRNSSVMDQDAAYRPKIYYSDGPLKGQEEEFPPPNNMNRKLRSLASIQQIGLFPPGSNSGNWRRICRY